MVFASAWANCLTVISIPATGTDDQALQQIFGTSLRNTSALPVFLQLFGNRIKEGCIDQCRHWNAHPLIGRNILMGISMFGLQGPPPLRSQSRTQRLNHRFAKGCLAFVSRIVEHPANRGTVPDRFASSSLLLVCFQTTTNLSNGAPISSDPLKDLTDDTCLFPHNLKACLSGPFLFGDITIPIRCSSQHAHFSDLRSMPLAAPTAL